MLTNIVSVLAATIAAQIGYLVGSWRLNKAYDSGFAAGLDAMERMADDLARQEYLSVLHERQSRNN